MLTYLAQRLLLVGVVVWGAATLAFVLLYLSGDPTNLLLPLDASAEVRATFRRAQGYDQPLYVQYARYLGDLEHGAFDAWDDEARSLLQDRWLVPTLAAPDGILSGKDALPAWMLAKTEPVAEKHRENTAVAHRAGVRIVAGTDAGTPFNPHGNLPRELELLGSVGLSPLEVLRAATTVAAEALDLTGQVGMLAPGAWADLVSWETDPLTDARAYRTPLAVVCQGRRDAPTPL